MIRTEKLTRIYRTEEVETTALHEIDLHVAEGEFVSIMGPSGCGKSTLLNVLGLLDRANTGRYAFAGTDVSTLSDKARAELRKNNIGFVFQNFNLIDELTVFENVELPLVYLRVAKGERKSRVDAILEQMGMIHRRNHYPQQLSGGQQQRVAVSRAVVNAPKLILADEPTGNLDTAHGNEVMDTLTKLNEQGTTIVMVTHSHHDAAFSSRIVRLLDGQVVSEDQARVMI